MALPAKPGSEPRWTRFNVLGKALETDSPHPGSYAAVLTAQTRAIEAAIALCRRQAAG